MDHQYWHDSWDSNKIGFHEGQPNALLTRHFDALKLDAGARVLVPLCGKTKDIPWLISKGCHVIGAELSEMAVQALFDENDLTPDIRDLGDLKRYSADRIDIFAGDIFDLNAETLGHIDAVFDRAAFVALPGPMRKDYSNHLIKTTNAARQLLITFDYDQSDLTPPPHAIDRAEIEAHYAQTYAITELETRDVEGGLKGQCKALERATLLTPKP